MLHARVHMRIHNSLRSLVAQDENSLGKVGLVRLVHLRIYLSIRFLVALDEPRLGKLVLLSRSHGFLVHRRRDPQQTVHAELALVIQSA